VWFVNLIKKLFPYRSGAAKMTRVPGVSLSVTNRCAGCGRCAPEVCFVGAIQMVDGHYRAYLRRNSTGGESNRAQLRAGGCDL